MNTKPMDRTTTRLQVALAVIGIVVALFVIVLVGRFVANTFTTFTAQVECATSGSATPC